jgi:hypothetical protein
MRNVEAADHPNGHLHLIFRATTVIGSCFVWRARRLRSVTYDLRVDDPVTGEELQRQRIVRAAPEMPLRHLIVSLDGSQSFYFDEAAVNLDD